jgi:hypothetical protein
MSNSTRPCVRHASCIYAQAAEIAADMRAIVADFHD